jgi:hypothetical protein
MHCPDSYWKASRKCTAKSKLQTVTFAQDVAQILLDTDEPSEYVFTFESISDEHYTNIPVDPPFQFSTVSCEVPFAFFKGHDGLEHVCVGNDLALDRWPRIHLDNESRNVSVTYEVTVQHGLTIASLGSFTATGAGALDVERSKFDTVGKYSYILRSVRDETGCSRELMESAQARFDILVNETPGVIPSKPEESLCEGDDISFSLQGTPPWMVHYKFGNSTKQLKVPKHPGFKLKFAEAGTLEIYKVCHGSGDAQCCASISDELYTVHALPSAAVSGGENKRDVIREGQ